MCREMKKSDNCWSRDFQCGDVSKGTGSTNAFICVLILPDAELPHSPVQEKCKQPTDGGPSCIQTR